MWGGGGSKNDVAITHRLKPFRGGCQQARLIFPYLLLTEGMESLYVAMCERLAKAVSAADYRGVASAIRALQGSIARSFIEFLLKGIIAKEVPQPIDEEDFDPEQRHVLFPHKAAAPVASLFTT